MGIFQSLKGTLNSLFQIGGASGAGLKNNSGVIEVRNSSDTAFATLRANQIQSGYSANDVPSMLDLLGSMPNIQFSFTGASAPSAGSNSGKFGFCHTTGGSYTAGDVVYDNGTTLIKIQDVRSLTTTSAISGTISLIANGHYALESGSWVLKGDGTGATTGIVKVIEIAYAFGSTTLDSSTSIPTGARVVRVENVVQTAFNGGSPTIAVTINGSTPLTLLATTDSDLKTVNQYETMEIKDVASINAGIVRAVVAGSSSTVGAGKLQVYFTIPLA